LEAIFIRLRDKRNPQKGWRSGNIGPAIFGCGEVFWVW